MLVYHSRYCGLISGVGFYILDVSNTQKHTTKSVFHPPVFIFLLFANRRVSFLSLPLSLPFPLSLSLVAVGGAASLSICGFGPLRRGGERRRGSSKSVPGVVVGAAKCGQSSRPLLGAKHAVGPWRKEADRRGTHCKLIGHKTFSRTHKMRKTQQQKLLLSLSLEVLSLKHWSCLKELEVNAPLPLELERKNPYSFAFRLKVPPPSLPFLHRMNRGDSLPSGDDSCEKPRGTLAFHGMSIPITSIFTTGWPIWHTKIGRMKRKRERHREGMQREKRKPSMVVQKGLVK